MLILASTSDSLTVATSIDGPVDVHASWVDTVTAAGTITPGRKNTVIAVAGPATAVLPPAASTQRNIKTLHVRNKHASSSCQVVVIHNDGANSPYLFDTVLGPGKSLQCTDQGGFRVL